MPRGHAQYFLSVANEYHVQQNAAKSAGKIKCKWRCHQTVPPGFGSECWLLERELILNKSPILLARFPRELNKCQRVGLVASCYQQSIVQTEVFQAIPKLTENFHCTYRCVTKQEEWHLLLECLEFDQVISSDVKSLPFPPAELRKTALVIGRKVVNECHPAGSRVGVIDCQTHRNDKEKVKCIIKDLNSGLQISVVMLVLSGTYSFSDDAEQLLVGTIVIMSLDEF